MCPCKEDFFTLCVAFPPCTSRTALECDCGNGNGLFCQTTACFTTKVSLKSALGQSDVRLESNRPVVILINDSL